MKYCKRCVMPDTRPGIKFDKNGICYPCLNAERKKSINWEQREAELRQLCEKYKRHDGKHDCIITVSGGKDSYFQVHIMKNIMKMNPLLLNVQNLSWTSTGFRNFKNMLEVFDCECEGLFLKRETARKMFRQAFEEYGSPTWYYDKAIYEWPLQIAVEKNILLIIYGENIAFEYGGPDAKETYSAKEQIKNDVVKKLTLDTYAKFNLEKIEPIYLSYFYKWSGYENWKLAKKYGFRDLWDTREWIREGYIEQYDQIDSPGYLVHPWLKYPKFGHARATDVSCYYIRDGLITRKYAINLVREHDHKLDPWALRDFCNFTHYTENEFWNIVEKFWNKEIFENVNGRWELKNPIWER